MKGGRKVSTLVRKASTRHNLFITNLIQFLRFRKLFSLSDSDKAEKKYYAISIHRTFHRSNVEIFHKKYSHNANKDEANLLLLERYTDRQINKRF